ncbi:MAG TPA: response regulator [Lacunisphaera sp.]|jgi:CheY-like chemotaxis protein|nr:response regulator [Lacunisphaera sp.]HQY06615.1 response regulator [Lacunisphaera sp.]
MTTSAPKPEEKIVVLVDDEFSYIDLLQQLLGEHLDRPVHGFTKPADALRALPALNVGLIITDYQMPEINGLQFIAAVQKINPAIPVLMITAYNMSFTDRELAAVPSLKAIVRKPFKWTELAAELVKYWPDANPPRVIRSGSPFQEA